MAIVRDCLFSVIVDHPGIVIDSCNLIPHFDIAVLDFAIFGFKLPAHAVIPPCMLRINDKSTSEVKINLIF